MPQHISWSGDELPSMEFGWQNINNFIGINAVVNETETPLDSSAYTMTGDESSTTLTFNKSYLDTLEEGEYDYRAYYSVNDWIDDHRAYALTQDENDPCVFRGKAHWSGDVFRIKDFYCYPEADPSLYTINTEGENVEVIFDKDFVEENGDKMVVSFNTETYKETRYDWIKLNVSADANTAESYETVYSDYQETGAPKTGDEGISAVMALMALSGVCVFVSGKRK